VKTLATPGAVIMLAGAFLIYWALTSEHGTPPRSWWQVLQGKDKDSALTDSSSGRSRGGTF